MAESSSRRGVLIGLGALVIVAGLVAAVAMWAIGGDRRSDAVASFARAPVGCDTTLDFVETGEYFIYVETAGRLDGIRGDCDLEGAYDVGSRTPDVEVTIVDPDGDMVEPESRVASIDYAEGGFVGTALFVVDITETDDHVIRVQSSDDEAFAVAIGRDPSEGVALLRGGAAAVGLLGVALGAVLIVLGARRSRATVVAPQWAPGVAGAPATFTPGQAPQGPPVYGQQAGPPPYQQTPPAQPSPYGQPAPPPQPQYGQPPAPQAPPQQQAPPQRPPQMPPQMQYGQHTAPGAPPQSPVVQPPPQQQPQPHQQSPRPAPQVPPQPQQAPPPTPQIPGQPAWGAASSPGVPHDPANSAQPIDWSPQRNDVPAVPDDNAPPDEDVIARLRDERERGAQPTDERPPPAPPN